MQLRKKIIPHLKHTSPYFHKLRRIQLELEYHLAVRAKNKKNIYKSITMMNDFYKECLVDLKKAHEYITVMKEIALTLVKIKVHILK